MILYVMKCDGCKVLFNLECIQEVILCVVKVVGVDDVDYCVIVVEVVS